MTGSGAGWPDEDTRHLLDWVAAYLRDLGVADADDHAMAIVVQARWMGWRPTDVQHPPAWRGAAHHRAAPDTARATAAQIRAALGWLPTDTPDDSTGDETP
ncbi:hypothetical protein [Streptomonospora wellingtoniae]|uniref:Uncharacterized protein n=1 Tax=Streptomonospora wellingtoniae TaxID=3075544 RepID=A0ABU2L0K8_9ACTN|nr:hypothetical protein [Streptomonospora sp. DSM 45055]MDT0305091.1 hypothetical protein [Streptomonospora sp. DSM 45055]